ncbi:sulfite exporter TauE/SafE family protein [Ensifer sp. ENS04]|uniref:TSUP family transporter n=1 Tax=Ensifer sp. ENS04 TaxID=2769281 RepID=UPI00177F4310|nr:sulfite exporter TauE/SafE family protein [Ensifer sp. ENS04]
MNTLILTVAAGAVIAGFVQGISGFAFGLVAISVWAWTLDPLLASGLTVFGAFTGQLVSAVTVRRGFDSKRLAPFVVGGLVGIPLGMAALPVLDARVFKGILGGTLVVWCPLMLLASRIPQVTYRNRTADGLVGLLGGVAGGLGGFTGVIPTLWCTLQGWDKDTQRSVIQNFNLVMLTATLVAYLITGIIKFEMWPLLAIVAAAVVGPSMWGARVYLGLSQKAFRVTVLVLLTCSGAAMLTSALR